MKTINNLSAERYITETLQNIYAPKNEKERIEADLRSYFAEAQDSGEPASVVIERLGSPIELAESYMSQTALDYVGFWPRVAGYLIDIVIIILVVGFWAILAIFLANLIPNHPQGLTYLIGALLILMCIGCVIACIGTLILYFPILEGRFGQTVGKKLLKHRVLRENGLPIGYKEAFIRRISYFFEFLPIDALFIPFNAKKQRAFDMIARTVVIHVK